MNDKVKRLQKISNKWHGYMAKKYSKPMSPMIDTILCDIYWSELPIEPSDKEVELAIKYARKNKKFISL